MSSSTKNGSMQRCLTRPIVENCFFEWIIDKFSFLNQKFDEYLESERFSPNQTKDGVKFHLRLYPKGFRAKNKTEFENGLFLRSDFGSTDMKSFQVKASCVLISKEIEIAKFNFQHLYSRINTMHGFSNILEGNSKHLQDILQEDQLTIQCSLEVAFEIQSLLIEKSLEKINAIGHPYNEKLLNNIKSCDITFLINNQELKAHKSMLAVASPVFDLLFENDWKENKSRVIVIEDSSFEVMQEMLRYIYTGKVENAEDMAHELLYVADKYDVKELKDFCEEKLCAQIDLDNVWTMFEIAENCQANRVKQNVIRYVVSNKEEAIKQPDFSIFCAKMPHVFIDIFTFKG